MVEVPRVAKYRRGVGEAAFILLADCPQSISMVAWDIKEMTHCCRLLVILVLFRLRIGLAHILSRLTSRNRAECRVLKKITEERLSM